MRLGRIVFVILLIFVSCSSIPRDEPKEKAVLDRAKTQFLLENYPEARQSFERYLELTQNPNNPAILYYIGLCRLKEDEIKKSIKIFHKALEYCGMNPLSLRIHYALSNAYEAMGDFSEALRELKIIRILPERDLAQVLKMDEYYYRFGVLYLRTGDIAHGREYLEKVDHESIYYKDAILRIKIKPFAIQVYDFLDETSAKVLHQRLRDKGNFVLIRIEERFVLIEKGFKDFDSAKRRAYYLKRLGYGAKVLP
jgi:tetratricopeptide (TPR) repeat protein